MIAGLNSRVIDPTDASSQPLASKGSNASDGEPLDAHADGSNQRPDRIIPVRGNYYRVRPWMLTLAAMMSILWLISTVLGYNQGVSDAEYDEIGVLESYGVSLMISEQAESYSWLERWVAGVVEKEVVQQDAIRTLEFARKKSHLEEEGIVTLACLYWAVGDLEKCRSMVDELPAQEYITTGVLVDLLDGEALDDDQWTNFHSEIEGWPRDWTTCFLAEKALESQSINYDGSDSLMRLIDQRKQGFLIAQAQISIVSWSIFLAGIVCMVVLIRKRKTLMPVNVPPTTRRVPRLQTLWPLSLAIIVYVSSDYVASWITSGMWEFAPASVVDGAYWGLSILIDSFWRMFGVMVMILVFFVHPSFVKRTLFKPVPKLGYWVFAACAVTWIFDSILYELPDTWFPSDPTVGHQWEDFGWPGLVTGLISAVIFAPVCEEIIFRGLLYNAIKNRLGSQAGIWISAVIFTSVHFYGLQDLIAVGFFGVVMAYLYRYTNSLLPCILCHALFNLIVTVWNWILYQSPVELWTIG